MATSAGSLKALPSNPSSNNTSIRTGNSTENKTGINTDITTSINPALTHFTLAKYRFTFCVKSEVTLPAYKGSAFHGGFGHALKKIAPSFYDYFFAPGTSADQPKPFVLLPPMENNQHYPPGSTLQFELVLIGNAIQHLPICFAAFDTLGQQLGLGATRGNYHITKVEQLGARDTALPVYENGTWHTAPATISAADLVRHQASTPARQLNLHFQTNLRLKENNKLLPHTPPFTLLLQRLLGRLHTLNTYYHQGELLSREQRQTLLEQAQHIHIAQANTRWVDWSRYSGRQKEWMKFGGLQGTVTYQGDLTPFIPYLAIGEWVHVGGKTSFGLGKITMEINE